METRLCYSPSKCFETFPFPRPTDAQREAMAATGEAFYSKRADIMRARQKGMTQVWNDLVDEGVWEDDDINALRRLRDAMDRAVLAAYGWSDLEPTDKDAIIRRLRKLNAERAAEEAAAAKGKTKK